MNKMYRVDTPQQTLVLCSSHHRLPQVIYWGAPLPDNVDLSDIYAAQVLDVTGGMLDENPELSLSPEASRSFPGQPGLILRDTTGRLIHPKFRFDGADTTTGLRLTCTDQEHGLKLIFDFVADIETGILTAQTTLETAGPVYLDWLAAPVFPASQQSEGMIDYSGRWIGEFQPNRIAWTPGIHARENRTGRTGHEHFPGLVLPGIGATNTQGEAYAFHYGWSGGHKMIAEELPDGRRQIQWGHAPRLEIQAGTRFETAPLYLAYSQAGLNGCAVAFQRHLRDRIVTWAKPDAPRPVHYNCWEAIYFDHNIGALKDIATRAADLGAERFVLDDGWFGKRDDDTSGLGDWTIDQRKYPQGLGALTDHLAVLGMGFGIWFEPEMVNPDSDLYRAHPDWALGRADQVLGRQQMVLDLANPEVRDHLYDGIAALLRVYPVEYIKWDHNRVLPAPDAAQTRGTYALLDRLRHDFPTVEIESCSSGGGRIDFGIMARTQRVWLSDSNDALERLKIQHHAAQFLPMAVTGSHVGPRHCHTSGRTHSMAFRGWVAAQRHMGFEMDPRELTTDEAATLTFITRWWKDNRSWLCQADILRLDSPDPAVLAEQQTSRDGARFVAFVGKADTSLQILPRPLRLTRLDPLATYRIDLVNRSDLTHLSRGAPALKSGPVDLSGAYLMRQGLNLPWSFPDTMWVLEGTKL